ncbi:MAG: protein-L-isoaspartate(D-aspartate) O-methyltransferase [Anaerolineae bacterium]|nr:protein-L-isoaspartate(D-aspartate) O-methyltransferase [Anaerolineae bacterium]
MPSQPEVSMKDEVTAMLDLIRARGIRDPAVLGALGRVPRQRFVPPDLERRAYGDYPLSIGHGQTISQPYIVALMTLALELERRDRVLEIGTGSGYQAAILAEMGMEVYTLEVIPALYEEAQARLVALGYTQIHCRLGDGHAGWPEHAPYQGIIATAAPEEIPPSLVEQLAEGGRLIIPVGPWSGYQTLWKVIKVEGRLVKIDLGGVAFVPFV